MGRQQYILGSRRAILNPVAVTLLGPEIAADHYGAGNLAEHLGVWMQISQTLQPFLVCDHQELPGLLVAGGRGVHGRSQHLSDAGWRHPTLCISADATPGHYAPDGFHCCSQNKLMPKIS
jgi:hypothetical protein